MSFLKKAAVAAMACLFISTAAQADDHKAGDISFGDAWARASATPAARAGAAYVNITNTGAQDDVLIGGASSVSKRVEIHVHKHENGVMKMRPAGDVTIPAGEEVTMGPGGLHVMLMGLNQPLKEGETFEVTLTFKNSGEVTVPVTTMGVAAKGSGGGHGHGHGDGHGHGHGTHGKKTTN